MSQSSLQRGGGHWEFLMHFCMDQAIFLEYNDNILKVLSSRNDMIFTSEITFRSEHTITI